MAQKTIVTLVDDIDGGQADESVLFGVDGVSYQIDLSDTNAKQLRDSLAVFVDAGRRIGGRTARRGPGAVKTGAAASKDQPRAIREWARANSHDLSDRGRIPASVIQAFEKAH